MVSRRHALPVPIAFMIVILLNQASGLYPAVVPNTSIEAGSQNVLFNVSLNNTNSTLNITRVNITLPAGFSFLSGSNQTSSSSSVFQDSAFLEWINQTPGGLIPNLSSGWFVFNSSVNTTPGGYNLTVQVTYHDSSSNSSVISLTLNDTTPPSGISFQGLTPANGTWTNSSWFLINLTFAELNPDTCLLDLGNGTSQNHTMSGSGSMCWLNATNQSQGSINWSVWINDTSGNLAWNGTWHVSIGPIPYGLSPGSGAPANGSVTNNDWFFTNFTFREANPLTCLLLLSNGTDHILNMTLNSTQGFCSLNVTGQGEGHLNYSFWINNTAGASNSSDMFFITLDHTPTMITNRSVDSGYGFANVSWETSFPADSRVFYGTGSPSNLTMNQTSLTLSTNRTINLSGLLMGMMYFYNITSCDNLSICNTSGTWNLTTLCIENWTYGSWGACSNGIQTRSSTDHNSCGTTTNRSSISQSCDDGGGGSSGGSGGSDAQPTVTKVFSSISPGNPAILNIRSSGIAATMVRIDASIPVSTSKIVVKGFPNKPSGVPVPPRQVQSYFNITTTANMSRISRAVIEFSVDRSWIDRFSINESTIGLMRFNDSHGSWLDLQTRLFESSPDNLSFRVTTPGFSWFAVAGTASANATEEPANEPQEPPPIVPEDAGDQAGQGIQEGVCQVGEMKCLEGIFLQKCNAWGTGWLNERRCFYGCREGSCTDSLVIEIDYNSLWISIAASIVIASLVLIYIKRRDIDDFIFWRF